LVHEEYLGIDHERAHERHALPHAAGQRGRKRLLEAREAREGDGLANAPRALGPGDAAILEAERDVARDGAPREDRVLLEDVADMARRRPRHRRAVDQDGAGVRRHEPADHVEDGGLAAAGRPDDGDELALEHLEGGAIHRGHLAPAGAEGLREVADDDARAPGAQDLYVARAFFTNAISTALAYGTGLSTASGTHTFVPFPYDFSSTTKSQSKIDLQYLTERRTESLMYVSILALKRSSTATSYC